MRMDTDRLAGLERNNSHHLRTVSKLLGREQIAEAGAAFAAADVVLDGSLHVIFHLEHRKFLLLFMIFAARLNGLGAVKLLKSHDAG